MNTPDELVYLVRGRSIYHWSVTFSGCELAAGCTSWPLDEASGKNPVSVRIEERCTGNGCAHRWRAWLTETTRQALESTR